MAEEEKIEILVDVLGSYYHEGKKQLMFHCPKCEHRKKKLSINVEKNVFKCWVCDFSGRNIFRIIKKYGTYSNKKKWQSFAKQVEIEDFSNKLFGKEQVEQESIKLPEEFISLANKNLPPTSTYPLNYLYSRGVTKLDIIKWKIGYCSTGPYEGRVIFPSFDLSGNLNYFVGRSYDRDWKRYMNPPSRNNMIFNHLYLDFLHPITIVEGVFDALKAGMNSVPLLGSTFSEKSLLLSEIVKNDTTVYLALDSDAHDKTNKLIQLLLKYDIEIKIINLSDTDYDDVGEMSHSAFQKLKSASQKADLNFLLINKIINL